jgi:hypothetical protein
LSGRVYDAKETPTEFAIATPVTYEAVTRLMNRR